MSQPNPPITPLAGDAKQAAEQANWAEALESHRAVLGNPTAPPEAAADALRGAVGCLQRLNRIDEFDELIESAVKSHSKKWRLLAVAAKQYQDVEHHGRLVAGEFVRGAGRGRAKIVNSWERDRVRALQLYHDSVASAMEAGAQRDASGVLLTAADTLHTSRGRTASWRLQMLTDLQTLPDYEDGWGYGQDAGGAPVDGNGEPILYDEPASWADAISDGERWRWLLAEATRWDPENKLEELRRRTRFSRDQFGVGTIGGIFQPYVQEDDGKQRESIWSLHTLTDDETIARLAIGIRRFELPAEQNYVRLMQQALEHTVETGDLAEAQSAAEMLGQVMLDRRQYPRAAGYFRQAAALAAEAKDARGRKRAEDQLKQIVGPWGEFQRAGTQPAGEGAKVGFQYRNATSVDLIARRIDDRRLIADVKAYLDSKPKQLQWRRLDVEATGQWMLERDREKYLGEVVAEWSVDLDPPEAHFDRRTTIGTPLQTPGAYLVSAKVADGNECHIVLWVADTAIVTKPQRGRELFFVADAATGRPVPGATLELFGYQQERNRDKPNDFNVQTRSFAAKTNADGVASLAIDKQALVPNYNWLAIATTEGGRRAYLGFNHYWSREPSGRRQDRSSAYLITDRPVYRPEQTVHFKAWIQEATYGADNKSDAPSRFAHKAFRVELLDAKQEKVFVETITANAFGGVEGEYKLPAGAPLGVYQVIVDGQGSRTFRVEEYKKPEFEVTVEAPDEAVALGDAFEATIRAKYYFGSPVTRGTVKYKVTRTSYTETWYPPTRWDWLYGAGYWWFGGDESWRPGWARWGCLPPRPPWWRGGWEPPEVVAEGQATLGPDGQVKLPIDTSLAKELHGGADHRYTIEAEVTDESRRTITGSSGVIVSRKPLKLYVWLDRGHYEVGDTLTASVTARRPGGGPVAGPGKLRLLKLSFPGGASKPPREAEVRAWELPTGADGAAELQIKASQPGQYRLAYELPDGAGGVIEGAAVFTIDGAGFDSNQFAYSDLEVTPDKRNYQPGEKVKLRLSTNRAGGRVLLFVRPIDSVYPAPKLVEIDGKSTVVEINVTAEDMPNFFVEAVTVSAGEVHTVAKQIAVPPVERALAVEVLPSAEAYLPGQQATMKIKLTDLNGEPYAGETVVAVYDKSVEYIAGGSNVPGIREHFWDWKRNHSPSGGASLDRVAGNLVHRGEKSMQTLGRFGGVSVPIMPMAEMAFGYVPESGGRMFRSLAAPAEAAMADESAVAKSAAPAPPLVTPTVRQEFADTAFWAGSLQTDSSGIAEVAFTMPDNLTAWKTRVWGMGHGARVGEASAEVVTRKNLLVRLQTPRFLVERDEVVLSANVHNYLSEAKDVAVRLELEGDALEATTSLETTITVPADSDRRVDWRLKAVSEGEAVVRALALTDEESDAMQLKLPVRVHGAERWESFSGVIARAGRTGAFEFTVPEARRAEATRLEVRYSPTLAGSMIDALPYLIDYPHGCTEQTLNRFLPAVLTQQTMQRMGIDFKQLAKDRTNLDPAQVGGQNAWERLQTNPVFDPKKLDKIVATGVRRLSDMQLTDGGWGWFSGFGERSTPHTTAVVVRGLLVAQENDVAIVPGVVDRGVGWLRRWQAEQLAELKNTDNAGEKINKQKPAKRHADNLDALVHLVLTQAGKSRPVMRDYLFRDRPQLSPYGLALLGVALDLEEGQDEKLDAVVTNLKQYLVTDDENQTAYLNLPETGWWYWHGSEYETHAFFLKLLSLTEPDGDTVAGLVKYLVANRRHATRWNSTRDTALVIEAMADYLKATGEGRPEMTVEVWLDGQRRKQVAISVDNLMKFDNRFIIEGVNLEPGRHTLELRKEGGGRLYWSGYLTNFSLEDDLRSAGLDLRVERKLYKLTPKSKPGAAAGDRGQIVTELRSGFERSPIVNFGSVESGDLVEVELTLESKNDYEYLIVTDPKPAGMEPVEVRSGYNGNELGAYVEYRDAEVNLFLRSLARGRRSVTYRLRAETPGQFAALPTTAEAMYAPELRGNSDEVKVRVVDTAE